MNIQVVEQFGILIGFGEVVISNNSTRSTISDKSTSSDEAGGAGGAGGAEESARRAEETNSNNGSGSTGEEGGMVVRALADEAAFQRANTMASKCIFSYLLVVG